MVLYSLQDYDKKIAPFLRNGILIDTCTLWEFIQGLIYTQRGHIRAEKDAEYQKIVGLLESIKLADWKKGVLTPHIMTETCSHVNQVFNRAEDFNDIGEKVVSIIRATGEHVPTKIECIDCYEFGEKLEPGDLSIYAVADKLANEKKKISILTKDEGFRIRYAKHPHVMVIDHTVIQDLY